DLEKQTPMQANMIFMGYSLTKIATAIGAMIGLEQGLFQLDDPVAQYLPEFKTLQVLNSNHPQAQNVLTIRHLLTMTGGMSLIWGRSEV
ncbi:serine hydrolase, partial [Rhizobium sp. KAs_5_22]